MTATCGSDALPSSARSTARTTPTSTCYSTASEPNLSDRDFFIRKAIGWALRDLAWTDLDTVESYVARNHDRLSPLSRREALKNAAKICAQTSP